MLTERLDQSGAAGKRKLPPSLVGFDAPPRQAKRPLGQRAGIVISKSRPAERTPPTQLHGYLHLLLLLWLLLQQRLRPPLVILQRQRGG